jgi:hypothetical protein
MRKAANQEDISGDWMAVLQSRRFFLPALKQRIL